MTGSLVNKTYKSGNTYYCQAISFTDETGTRKKKWLCSGIKVQKGNKRKAEEILKEKEKEFFDTLSQTSTTATSDSPLFLDYVKVWLSTKKNTVSQVTFEGYEQQIDLHIIPYFKDKNYRLVDMTEDIIQAFYNYKLSSGRLDGKGGLTGKSIHQIHNVVNQVMKRAVSKHKIDKNPVLEVTRPKIEVKQAAFYDSDEVDYLLSCIDDNDPFKVIVLLTSYYGLRRSEVMALRWQSVSFKNESLTIEHTVVRRKTLVYKDTTKNKSSRRTYPMLGEVKSALLELKARQENNKKLFGKQYHHSDYVFTWEDGTVIIPDYATQKMRKVIKQNNLKKITFHQLRHSCASILISEYSYSLLHVKDWLGHSDIKLTGNLYGHLEKDSKIEMAKQLDKGMRNRKKNKKKKA